MSKALEMLTRDFNVTNNNDFTTAKTMDEALQMFGVNLDQFRHYYKRVDDVLHEMIKLIGFDPIWAKGYWKSGPNVYYNQLDLFRSEPLSLALIEYYGKPATLATPLGGITFHGGRGEDEWWKILNEKFGLKPLWGDHDEANIGGDHELDAVYVENVGEFGPVWSVTKDCEGNDFGRSFFAPNVVNIPSMRHTNHISYDIQKEIWNAVKPAGYRD